jgi:ABC 3 transport family
MFEYDFMRTAFAASGIVAVLSGVVGFFLVMRGQTFAGHALSHVGFTGATGAVLVGVSPSRIDLRADASVMSTEHDSGLFTFYGTIQGSRTNGGEFESIRFV